MKEKEFKLLLVEDDPLTGALAERELRAAELRFTSLSVNSRERYEQALEGFKPDIVLCDFSLRGFEAKQALGIRNERAGEVPFLFLSGAQDVEAAVEALKLGATDYVTKDWMHHLPFCVRRAMREAQDRRERRRMETELREAEKTASVGLLLGGVAHELNNPLMGILGHAQLLLSETTLATQSREDLAVIEREAKRCKRLIKSLLTYARQQERQFEWVDLQPKVTEIVELKSFDMRRASISLTVELDPDSPRVYADPHQIQQVLMNLLNNAEQAINGRKGGIVVKTAREGEDFILEVADDGPGIAPEDQERIFEPFFTTKPPGLGTGLGLSICAEIAKDHGGTLSVASEPGRGARFKLRLPAAAPKGGIGPAVARPRQGRTLIVDDDDMILKFMARVLRQEGWEVDAHSVAADALEAVRSQSFDLVVCDFHMPAMHGGEFYRLASAARPSLAGRFILCTGAQHVETAKRFAGPEAVPILVKPFDIDEFRRVMQTLGESGDGRAAG